MQSTERKREPYSAQERGALPVEVRNEILDAIAGIEYGSVEVVIHNSKVVQIEAREKLRFAGGDKPPR